MSDPHKPVAAAWAISALMYIGEPAFPLFHSALSDPNQSNRSLIVNAIASIVRSGHTNSSLRVLVNALNDQNFLVRKAATNAIQSIAPHLIANAPAN
jgi:HEAT repeat protein